MARSTGIHPVVSHESSAIPCTHRVYHAAQLTRVAGYVSRDASVCSGGPLLVCLLGYANHDARAVHIYAYLRVRTFDDASSMFRCTMGCRFVIVKVKKRDATARYRPRDVSIPEHRQTMLGGLNSVTRTQITMDLYFSPSFSRALVIYSQPWRVCFVCSRVPVKYFTGRNERNESLIA